MKIAVIPFLCGTALVACTPLSPEYVIPSLELSDQFINLSVGSLFNASSQKWWERLNDPMLNALVARGSQQNLDVQAALARMDAAEASLGTVGVNGLSTGGLDGSITRVSFAGTQTTRHSLPLSGQTVPDLFGGAARHQDPALANFDAAQLNVGVVRLAYLTDLTSAYVQARYFQEAAAITRTTMHGRWQTLNLLNQRREAGEATELEMQRGVTALQWLHQRWPAC